MGIIIGVLLSTAIPTMSANIDSLVRFPVGKSSYSIGNEVMSMDAVTFIENGRTYVPVRYIALALDVQEENIGWDPYYKRISLYHREGYLTMDVGETAVWFKGEKIETDVPPIIREGRTYLPARYVAEAFGYSVGWESDTKTVTITLPLKDVLAKKEPEALLNIERPKWIENVMIQPLPADASPVRLSLPVPLEKLRLDYIGGFGAHEGGHMEGLDHVWLSVDKGTPVGSWADGKVVEIELSGEIEKGEIHITIDYGQGLKGVHMEVDEPLVKVGDTVKAGQPVGYGMTFFEGLSSAEFALLDNNRIDGIANWIDISRTDYYVSPFDYLQVGVQTELIDAYMEKVIDPYISQGKSIGNVNPWEPFLSNPLLLHQQQEGFIHGEWYLQDKWETGGYPDLLTLMEVNHMYYKGNRVAALDDSDLGPPSMYGTFEVDYDLNRIKIISNKGTHYGTYYGIFELDESGDRAQLKFEYQEGSYPKEFSQNAAIYLERLPYGRRIDGGLMGSLEIWW